jgi:2,3-bisphosphoglycerate-independent phosphoglycerate mutase
MGPVVTLILDGWGIGPKGPGNAIELAKKPNYEKLLGIYPNTTLRAHGKYVGVPKGQVGNSEAGHVNIGAGRLVKDDAMVISEEIENGKFKKNLALKQVIEFVKENKSCMHIMGLISDNQSPHAVMDHLYNIVDLCHGKGIEKIYLHLFTDGRDSAQFGAIKIIDEVEKKVFGKAQIVTLIGRHYAMDRVKHWERTEMAYDCLTVGKGELYETEKDAILHAYNKKVTDEYLEPSIIAENQKQVDKTRIKEEDGVIFFNARSDRARQLTKCFVQKQFNKMNRGSFKRKKVYKNIKFCALTDFGPDLDSLLTAYPSGLLDFTLPLVLKHMKQLYIAETEKYAHVTYFMNGGSALPVNGEARVHVSSPTVRSYATKPEMSVYEITKNVEVFIEQKKYDYFLINFANPDMVGHTGNLKATIRAIEHVDKCIGRLVKLVLKKQGVIMITADHGNAEKMIDPKTGEVWARHTTNPVPFMLIGDEYKGTKLMKNGTLSSIAPTVYQIYDLKKIPKKLNKGLIK